MKVLVAPDKFAGTMSAVEAGEAIAAGWRSEYPGDTVRLLPMADGGPGTVTALAAATGAEIRMAPAADQRGREVLAPYIALDGESAIVEAASACGLHLVPEAERSPLEHDTRGVGTLMSAMMELGFTRVLVGLGGTGTVDGGVGAALSMGASIVVRGMHEKFDSLPPARFGDISKVGPIPALTAEVVAVTDVSNPLLGDNGAAMVFGPQKGASPSQVEILESSLAHLADVVEACLPGGPWRERPGAGAAGGLGFGLMAWAGATVTSGAQLVGDLVRLRDHVEWCDFVVTGEGSMDRQSLEGKAPFEVLRAAQEQNRGTGVVVGRIAPDLEAHPEFVEVMGPSGLEDSIGSARRAGARLARRAHLSV